jgi:pre-mRNA-splicing factor CDC5/CEF1
MVRVFIKGGVWKNSEDEILKAAVMKYGKQQWARVASLLNRKSAKQCKARWNEWLDPSIRKIEWSREEDEKLLHLAKLMPAQWKTIGPLVGGRTAVQCQERYEQLLDEAAMKDGEHVEEDEAGSSKKLRAGDIDPHPETKPARPDPIDMDEDEIEMLQEARARLANTQGKKAKRKAREKMLQEAKRLADLQKRRELKQAGLLSSAARTKSRGGKRARKEIDLGVEIPFHKPAPAGFHSTADEDAIADEQRRKRMKQIDFKQINEAQYNSRDREEKAATKREEARLKSLERSNMQYVVAQTSKKNDPIAARKRGVLSLPEPTITDTELEKVAKLATEQRADNEAIMNSSGTGAATDALLGDYTDRPLPTPMRTPMTGSGLSKHEVIMREASNLRMLEKGQTPLIGNMNPELIDDGSQVDLDNRNSGVAAPTPMISASATPSVGRNTLNQTPMSQGHRDKLGLNRPNSVLRQENVASGMGDDVSISGTSFATSIGDRSMSIKELARAERNAAKRARKELELALANLPAPQFEYELGAPEPITDDDGDERMVVERDAADIEAEAIARLEAEAAKRYEERSSVVKRADLPRPLGAIHEAMVVNTVNVDFDSSSEAMAHQMLEKEALLLLQHDAFSFPLVVNDDTKSDKKSKKDKKKKTNSSIPPSKPLEFFEIEHLDAAQDMLQAETDILIQEKRQLANKSNTFFESDNDFIKLLQKESIVASIKEAFNQNYSENGWAIDSQDKLSSVRAEFDTLQSEIKSVKKLNDKMDHKFSIKTGGYTKRYEAFTQSALETFAETQNSKIEENVYKLLLAHETRGIQQRIEKLQDEIETLEKTESSLQKQYGDLLHERNRQKILMSKRPLEGV